MSMIPDDEDSTIKPRSGWRVIVSRVNRMECRMPARLTSRFEDALVFAARLHREQRRKGSHIPYVSHLLAVAALVVEHGEDEDQAIAALLHDAIEDQGGKETRDEILRRFGAGVTRRGFRGNPNLWTTGPLVVQPASDRGLPGRVLRTAR